MDIGIVILNYKTYKMTINLVNQIYEIFKGFNYQIIVVDNNSPNESSTLLEEFERREGKFIFIKNDTNSGYASGNNIGIKYAVNNGASYVLVMNNDIEIISKDVLKRMISLMDSNPRIAAVSPKIVDGIGKTDPPIYYRKPSLYDLTLGIYHFQKERFMFDENTNCLVYAPRGSFMLLRASAIAEIGYLDEHTFLYYEEPILAERLKHKGYECWHCGETEVIHNHAITIKSSIKKKDMAKIVCESYSYYLRTYRSFSLLSTGLCLIIRYLAIMLRR